MTNSAIFPMYEAPNVKNLEKSYEEKNNSVYRYSKKSKLEFSDDLIEVFAILTLQNTS